jgi:hypothetical protein
MAAGGAFADLLRTHGSASVDGEAEQLTIAETEAETEAESKAAPDTPVKAPTTPKSGALMKVEERERGKVDSAVYLYYAAQCGKTLVLVVLCLFFLGQLLAVLNTYVMACWSTGDTSIIIGASQGLLHWLSSYILRERLTQGARVLPAKVTMMMTVPTATVVTRIGVPRACLPTTCWSETVFASVRTKGSFRSLLCNMVAGSSDVTAAGVRRHRLARGGCDCGEDLYHSAHWAGCGTKIAPGNVGSNGSVRKRALAQSSALTLCTRAET